MIVMSNSKNVSLYASFFFLECAIYTFEFVIINAASKNAKFLEYEGIACSAFVLLTAASMYYYRLKVKKENRVLDEKMITQSARQPPISRHTKFTSSEIDSLLLMSCIISIAFSMEVSILYAGTSSISAVELIVREAMLILSFIGQIIIASRYKKQQSTQIRSINITPIRHSEAVPLDASLAVPLPASMPDLLAGKESIEIDVQPTPVNRTS